MFFSMYAKRRRTYYQRRVRRYGRYRRSAVVRKARTKAANRRITKVVKRIAAPKRPTVTCYKAPELNIPSAMECQPFEVPFGTLCDQTTGTVYNESYGMIHCVNMQDVSNSQFVFGAPSDLLTQKEIMLRTKVRIGIAPGASEDRVVTYNAFHVKLKKEGYGLLPSFGAFVSGYSDGQATPTIYSTKGGAGYPCNDGINLAVWNYAGAVFKRVGTRVILNPDFFEIKSSKTFSVGVDVHIQGNIHVTGSQGRAYKALYYATKFRKYQKQSAVGNLPSEGETDQAMFGIYDNVPSRNEFILIFSDDARVSPARQKIRVLKEFDVQLS